MSGGDASRYEAQLIEDFQKGRFHLPLGIEAAQRNPGRTVVKAQAQA
jgi:hypothetical protein